jgi:dienelactone hydrolase
MHRRTTIAAAVAVAAAALIAPAAVADTYEDPAYAEFDVDNMSRSLARQVGHLTDPEFHADFAATAVESQLENASDQVREAPNGRVYGGLGQVLPGGSVGDPEAYHEVSTTEVNFLFRSGAKLEGHLFAPLEGSGPAPAVLITTGSIQGTQHMYWWAARTLARAGYLVLTWDVQGQGESETTPHAPGQVLPFVDPGSESGYTDAGVPFQQPYNFHEGTIDALRFLMSTPSEPYVPGGWTEGDLAAAHAAHDPGSEPIDWVNPLWATFDRAHIGLAGHSLGAGAVSNAQQCSDAAERWREIVDFCTRSFPVRAVVGWDRLQGGDHVPVVPGMDQQADGYFFNPQPTPEAPTPEQQLARVTGGAFADWRAAGVDTYTLTIRGGVHNEFIEVPYILPGTSYGRDLADHYTLAWMDRYVHPDPVRQAAAVERLRSAPIPTAEELESGSVLPWRANQMSARYAGAFSFHDVAAPAPHRGRKPVAAPTRHEAFDLRAYAGLSAVGDWAGANADRPTVRGTG